MMSLLNKMLEELKTKQTEFDQFWSLHKARVDHMMRMCHFNRTSEKVGPGEVESARLNCDHMVKTIL